MEFIIELKKSKNIFKCITLSRLVEISDAEISRRNSKKVRKVLEVLRRLIKDDWVGVPIGISDRALKYYAKVIVNELQ